MAAKTPKDAAEAIRLLEQADPTTRAGREQIRAVAEWVREDPDRVPVDVEAQVREAERRASSEGAKAFWSKPLEQVQWLIEKNQAAGEAIIRAVESFAAAAGETNIGAPASAGSRESLLGANELIRIAWQRMTPEERTEAFNRGMVPAPGSGWMPGPPGPDSAANPLARPAEDAGLTRGQQADAARLEAQRGRDVPAVGTPTTGETGVTASSGRSVEQILVDNPGMDPALAEMIAAMEGGDDDPLLGVPEGFRAPLDADPDRLRQFGRRAMSDQNFTPTEQPTVEPHYRQSDADEPYGWNEARLIRLQDMLVRAGFLDGTFRRGWYDSATRTAYMAAMGAANQRGIGVARAMDLIATQRIADRERARDEAAASFTPAPFIAPDRDTLRRRARNALIEMGRRRSDIDESEIEQMVSVMSGDYKRAHDMQQELDRRQAMATAENALLAPGEAQVQPDVSGIEDVDVEASFDEWFNRHYAGEIETREMGEEVARRGRRYSTVEQTFAGQIDAGGA